MDCPARKLFCDGDNRSDSYDSAFGIRSAQRFDWRSRNDLSFVDAPKDEGESRTQAWEPGHLSERFQAYAGCIVHPPHSAGSVLLHFF